MQVAVFYDPLICPFTGRCRFGHITEHWGEDICTEESTCILNPLSQSLRL